MLVGSSTAGGQNSKCSSGIDLTAGSTPSPEPPWKRGGFQSAEAANIAFWDDLSRVPLCPPALREFNRRNSLVIESTAKVVARSTTKLHTRSAPRRAFQVDELGRQSTVSGTRAAQLKRFARRGGPDLHDLRGV